MEPKEFDFEFPRGDTCPLYFELTDANGDSLNINTNLVVYFTVKKSYNTQNYIFQKKYSVSKKEITIEGTKCSLFIEHNDTAELPYGSYVYDIQVRTQKTGGYYVKTLVKGTITLTNESTWKSNE